tara:strand:- start:1031 stop:1327 length:297 start_codon:yes stop_codon:yes gene_type:complete
MITDRTKDHDVYLKAIYCMVLRMGGEVKLTAPDMEAAKDFTMKTTQGGGLTIALDGGRDAAKKRTCLNCGRSFLSAHCGNRVCTDCDYAVNSQRSAIA